MKLGRFEQQGRAFYGAVEGDLVVELEGSIFDRHKTTSKKHALASLRTMLPCMPANFYCAGLNYAAHIEWANKRAGLNRKPPEKADIGYRSPNALIATGEAIVIPADSEGPVQFEGELVAVIGKKARNLSEKDALSCVLGYTLGNDLSERNWQKQDRTLWRAKNCDSFNPAERVSPDEGHRGNRRERQCADRVRPREDAVLGAALHRPDHALHDASSRRRAVARHR